MRSAADANGCGRRAATLRRLSKDHANDHAVTVEWTADGKYVRRRRDPALLMCGRGLVFATAESENGLLSLWLRRHTTALAFGPCYARCKVLPGFRAVQIQSLRPLQAIPLVEATRLRASPTIAAIFPPAVLKVRPPQHEKCWGVELRLPFHTARSPTPSVGRCRTARACTTSTGREPQQG